MFGIGVLLCLLSGWVGSLNFDLGAFCSRFVPEMLYMR